jgi:DNA polymerase III epsilon subunit family exonuclease
MDRISDRTLHFTDNELHQLQSYFKQGLIGLDLETTGLSPLSDKIIEIAAIKLKPNGELKKLHYLVNPEIDIPGHTTDIHGINNQMIKDQPKYKEIAAEVVDFLEDLPVLAHNAQFDIGFMIKEHFFGGVKLKSNAVFDSCLYARKTFKQIPDAPSGFKLSTLADFFKIELDHHRAVDDALAGMRIMANCLGLAPHKPQELFNLKQFRKVEVQTLPTHLIQLESIIQQAKNCEIRYKGSSFGEEFRPIRPIGLFPMPNGTVLYAQCLLSNLNKSFLVKKIKELKHS